MLESDHELDAIPVVTFATGASGYDTDHGSPVSADCCAVARLMRNFWRFVFSSPRLRNIYI